MNCIIGSTVMATMSAHQSLLADSRERAEGCPARNQIHRGSRGAQADPLVPSPHAAQSGSPQDTGAPGPIRLFGCTDKIKSESKIKQVNS